MNPALLAVPIIVMGGVFAAISLYFWREGRDLRRDGIEAQAIISRKFRKEGDAFLLGLENYFITAEFVDAQGERRSVDIRAPSRQWHWLRPQAKATIVYLATNPARARVTSVTGQRIVGGILLFTGFTSVTMVLLGLLLLGAGLTTDADGITGPLITAPPTKFDKTGVLPVTMAVSPRHDRIAVLNENGSSLLIRELPSGQLGPRTKGNGWRLLGWRPDGARIAVAEGNAAVVLDSASLAPVPGETYSWNPPVPAIADCPEPGPIAWNTDQTQAALPCGNDVLIGPPFDRRLRGHTGRVAGAAWNAGGTRLASVSEDNYVRLWVPASQQCIAISEDYPYPRAVYFASDERVDVIDVAMRQYSMRNPRP